MSLDTKQHHEDRVVHHARHRIPLSLAVSSNMLRIKLLALSTYETSKTVSYALTRMEKKFRSRSETLRLLLLEVATFFFAKEEGTSLTSLTALKLRKSLW